MLFSVTYYLELHMLYLFIVDVLFYQVKLLNVL